MMTLTLNRTPGRRPRTFRSLGIALILALLCGLAPSARAADEPSRVWRVAVVFAVSEFAPRGEEDAILDRLLALTSSRESEAGQARHFSDLRWPVKDGLDLYELLDDPAIGGFDQIHVLMNPSDYERLGRAFLSADWVSRGDSVEELRRLEQVWRQVQRRGAQWDPERWQSLCYEDTCGSLRAPTWAGLEATLADIAKVPEAEVLLYFSTHGLLHERVLQEREAEAEGARRRRSWRARWAADPEEILLVGSDTVRETVQGSVSYAHEITQEMLLDALASLPGVRSAAIVKDACQDRPDGNKGGGPSALRFYSADDHRVSIAAAAKPGQPAMEPKGLTNGLYTHYLLEGLRRAAAGPSSPRFRSLDANRDDAISLYELHHYASKRMLGSGQVPEFNDWTLGSAAPFIVVGQPRLDVSQATLDTDVHTEGEAKGGGTAGRAPVVAIEVDGPTFPGLMSARGPGAETEAAPALNSGEDTTPVAPESQKIQLPASGGYAPLTPGVYHVTLLSEGRRRLASARVGLRQGQILSIEEIQRIDSADGGLWLSLGSLGWIDSASTFFGPAATVGYGHSLVSDKHSHRSLDAGAEISMGLDPCGLDAQPCTLRWDAAGLNATGWLLVPAAFLERRVDVALGSRGALGHLAMGGQASAIRSVDPHQDIAKVMVGWGPRLSVGWNRGPRSWAGIDAQATFIYADLAAGGALARPRIHALGRLGITAGRRF